MDERHRLQLAQLLEEAKGLPDPARKEFLVNACEGDPALLSALERLMAPTEAGATIEAPVVTPLRGESRSANINMIGREIGPYKVLSQLGEGGFGVVYLAERRHPHVQRVALKVIKPGMDSAAVIARFEQERQALAVMDHPNVARVLDAGVTDDGRPYFVMEHVKGEPITTFCDRQRLGVKDRLRLFITTCEAIQHAHMKGIIHRDIKPGNVLVATAPEGSEGGPGIPKVIDFGVAKAITHTLTDKSIFTAQGQIIGTPEYMSPEQAEMGATDIDTRTDVYSLGVVLYELLTGALPFDPSELRAHGYNEIQRIIREVDPPKPSTRLTSQGDHGKTTAANRRSRIDDLANELRRELEWIPLRAMRKSRAERYQTPLELAEDVRNYLAGLPLVAGPESAVYRIRKFVRRNRAGVAVAGALALGVAVSGVGLSVGIVRARTAERLEAAERARAENALAVAERERETTAAINEFLVNDLLASPRPLREGRSVTVVEVLDLASKVIAGRFADRPATRASLHGALGRSYLELGVFDAAESQLREAMVVLEAMEAPSEDDVVNAASSLAEVMWRQGRADDALAVLEPMLQSFEESDDKALSAAHRKVLSDTASAYKHARRFDDAEPLYQRSLALAIRSEGEFSRAAIVERYNLALLRQSRGELEGAAEVMQEVVALATAHLPPEDWMVAGPVSELASMHVRLGAPERAAPLYEKAIPLLRARLGPRHWRTLETLANYGVALRRLGRAADALPVMEEVVEGYREVRGRASPDTVSVSVSLSRTLIALDRRSDAEAVLLRAHHDVAAAEPVDRNVAARIARDIAEFYDRSGDGEKATLWNQRREDYLRGPQ